PADANYTILQQVHILPDVGEPPLSPPIDLILAKSTKGTEGLAIDVKWDTAPLTTRVEGGVAFTNGVKNIHQAYSENNPKRDTWNDFVFHVRLAPDSTGFLEVWKNGIKLNLTDRTGDNNGVYNGPTTYNQAPTINHNLRFGLYKRNYETVNLYKPFVFYYDSIRVSNTIGSAGYYEVLPR
ncbi:MAG TPA: heparin lyase I family protein, partial [Methylococcales bacterium]